MDKAKKKRLKSYIAWISLAALVAGLAAMPLLARSELEEGPKASILETTAQMGDLEVSLRGGGTLTAGTAEDVKLPSGVKITEFLVKNGDTVAEGDPVAAVDKVSVMTAILGVRETLDYLQEEMAGAKDDTAGTAVKATAGGKIKQVFAQKGDSVQDVMLRHGALAVLSLDDMMAVALEADTAYAAGDPLTVRLDGEEIPGRVESNLDGILVVTVSDENYEVGAPVTVTDGNTPIGEGTLFVHNAWKAVAFTGTVNAVSARENTTVYDGATLFTLKDTDFTGTLEGLAGLHREYEELLQELFAMHESGVITAPCGGEVSGVDDDSPFLLSAPEGEEGWFVDLLSQEEPRWSVMLLSHTDTPCTGDEACKGEEHEEDCPKKCTGRETCAAEKHDSGCAVYCTGASDCANLNHKAGCLGVCTGNDLCRSARSAKYHEKSCVRRCISDADEDPETLCDAEEHYPACIETCTESDDCAALNHKESCPHHGVTYTAVAAQVRMVSLEGLLVVPGSVTYAVMPREDGWELVSPDKLETVFVGDPQPLMGPAPEGAAAGDILLIVTGSNGYQETILFEKAPAQTPEQTPQIPQIPEDMGGFPTGGFGGMTGFGGFGGFDAMGQTPAFELFELEGETLLTVTEQKAVTLTITLDQRDISRVAPGQSAQVKINALKGRIFEAEVTEVGSFGTGSGGSSKFTVELTMEKDADMLPGMSAAVTIPLYTKKDVLTVPVAALTDEGGRTFVYTGRDPETGEPVSPVEVTLGLSDGERAEVLSGLASGDTCVYSYYDILELSTDVETEKFTFGG